MSSDLQDRIAQRCGEVARFLANAPADKVQEAVKRAVDELLHLAGVHA